MSGHTLGPLQIHSTTDGYVIEGANGELTIVDELHAARLIVRAVNSHDDLLAAAKEARDELSQYTAPWCEELAAKLDEAIEKAEDS